jgi:hypothetical protein
VTDIVLHSGGVIFVNFDTVLSSGIEFARRESIFTEMNYDEDVRIGYHDSQGPPFDIQDSLVEFAQNYPQALQYLPTIARRVVL